MAQSRHSAFTERRQIAINAQLQALQERAHVLFARRAGATCRRCQANRSPHDHCHSVFDFVDVRDLAQDLGQSVPSSVTRRVRELIECRAPQCDVLCLWLWGSRWFFRHVQNLGDNDEGVDCAHDACSWDWDFVAVIRSAHDKQEWFNNVLEIDNIDVAVYEEKFFERELIRAHAPWALQFLLHRERGGSLIETFNPLVAEELLWLSINAGNLECLLKEQQQIFQRWQRPILQLPYLKTCSLVNGQVNMRHARTFWLHGETRKAKKRVHYVVQMYNNMAQFAADGFIRDPTSSNWHTQANMGRLFESWEAYASSFQPALEAAFMNLRMACNEYRAWEVAHSSMRFLDAALLFVRKFGINRFCSVFGLDWHLRQENPGLKCQRITLQFAVSERTASDSRIALAVHGALIRKCACDNQWSFAVAFPPADHDEINRAILDVQPSDRDDCMSVGIRVQQLDQESFHIVRGRRRGRMWALLEDDHQNGKWTAFNRPEVGCASLDTAVVAESAFCRAMDMCGCSLPALAKTSAAGARNGDVYIVQSVEHHSFPPQLYVIRSLDKNLFERPTINLSDAWTKSGWVVDKCFLNDEFRALVVCGQQNFQNYVDEFGVLGCSEHRSFHEVEVCTADPNKTFVVRDAVARFLVMLRRVRLTVTVGTGGNPDQIVSGRTATERSLRREIASYWLSFDFFARDECIIRQAFSDGTVVLGRACEDACGGQDCHWTDLVRDCFSSIELLCLCIESAVRLVALRAHTELTERRIADAARSADGFTGEPSIFGLVCQLFRDGAASPAAVLRTQADRFRKKKSSLVHDAVELGSAKLKRKLQLLESLLTM